jgi:transcription antitermination protein NusB
VRAHASAMRHRSREVALQVLYALDLSTREGARREGAAAGDAPAQDAFEAVAAHFELPAAARAFAAELVVGVRAHLAELDAHLAAHAHRWRLERMAAVDRNVLRLAAYEILHSDTPAEVVIDEAVELARRFGGERSPAFVNGVLDALARELSGPGAQREELP